MLLARTGPVPGAEPLSHTGALASPTAGATAQLSGTASTPTRMGTIQFLV